MSGEHSIHVRLDAMSPRWSHQYYRYEHHFNFRLPSEDAVTAAVERISELCEQLRNPVQDAVPPDVTHVPDGVISPQSLDDRALERVRDALRKTEAQMGGPSTDYDDFDRRVRRAVLFMENIASQDG